MLLSRSLRWAEGWQKVSWHGAITLMSEITGEINRALVASRRWPGESYVLA
jgi:hypothetical protein